MCRDYTTEGRIIPHSWINRPQEIEQGLSSLWSGAQGQEASQRGVNTDFAMLEGHTLLCLRMSA